MRRQLRTVAAMAAVTVLAVGCSDDSGSSDEPDKSPSTSESASSDGDSGISDGSENPDVAGAEAYARRFVQTVNRAGDTGETKALHDLVAKCSSCQQYPATYDDIYANGGSVDGEFYQLLNVEATMQDDSTAQAVAKVKADTSTTFKMSKDAKAQPLRPETYIWTLELDRGDNGWEVVGMKEKF